MTARLLQGHPSPVTWKEHQDSLDPLLLSLVRPPTLGYPD